MTPFSPPDEREWFHVRNRRICGPTAPADLAELLGTGAIPPGTLVWCRGMDDWQGAADVAAAGLPAARPPAARTEGAAPAPWLPPPLPAEAAGAEPDAMVQGFACLSGSGPARSGYLAAHWRGEHPLGRSFWLNHLLIAGTATFVLLLVMEGADNQFDERPAPVLAFVLPVLALVALVQAWQIAGTWRAARRSREVLGQPVRAWFVRAILRLEAIVAVAFLLALVYVHGQAALSGLPIVVPGATVRDQGRRIDFSGPITQASPAQVRRALAHAPSARLVRLSSPGGSVAAAREIAGAIRAAGLDTEAVQDCVSACTLVFFSGRHRALHDGARLGFHSYSSPAMTPQAVIADEWIERQAYRAAGLPPAFISRIFSVPPNRLWYPSRPELVAAGFVTGDAAGDAPATSPPAVRAGVALPPPAQGQAPPAPVLASTPDPGAHPP